MNETALKTKDPFLNEKGGLDFPNIKKATKFSKKELSAITGMKESSIRADVPLSLENDEKTRPIRQILLTLYNYFGDFEKVRKWLYSGNPEWFGLTPAYLIKAKKADKVLEYIKGQVEYTGVFS